MKSTKEVAGFNGLADAFLRLDFIHALRDVRRFNFVSKIMSVLFSHEKLMTLPGAAQKTLFRYVGEIERRKLICNLVPINPDINIRLHTNLTHYEK